MKKEKRIKRITPTPPPPNDYREAWCHKVKPHPIYRGDETGVFGQQPCFADPLKILERMQEEKELDED
jgi:hypothetical protein